MGALDDPLMPLMPLGALDDPRTVKLYMPPGQTLETACLLTLSTRRIDIDLQGIKIFKSIIKSKVPVISHPLLMACTYVEMGKT